MSALAGPFLAVVALLGVAGATKVHRPATTARALRAMGLPSSPALVRAGAAVEVVVAVGALLWASPPWALAVALSYAAFAGFVLAALRRGLPLSSCGCIGGKDTPPTAGHVVLNLAAAGVAGAVALGTGRGAAITDLGRLHGSLLLRAVFVVLTAMCAWFAYVALTELPRTETR